MKAMKTKTMLFLGLGAAAIAYVVNQTKATIGALQFAFKGIHINKSIKNFSLSGTLTYEVTNPTSSEIVLQWFKGKLFYGNFFFTNIIIKQQVLKPQETITLTVDFSTPILKLAGEIQELITNGWFIQQFHINGDLIFKVGNFPAVTTKINQNIDLSDKYGKGQTP